MSEYATISVFRKISSFLLPCSCQSRRFHYKDCCEDYAIHYPTKCVHSKQLAGSSFKRSNSVKYFVTSGCYMLLQYELFKEELCKSGDGENNTFSDIFSSYPVHDLYSGISYLNMYCYLCNTSPYRSFNLGKPWDIELYCEKYIEYGNFILIKHLLKTIIETKCNVTKIIYPDSVSTGYDKHSTPKCQSGKIRYNGICNSTEKWLVEDPDIKYACENVASGAFSEFHAESNKCELPFKNVFCALCNLEVVENISIYECSVGRMEISELDEIGCHFFPKINFYSPYKNLFCKHCNNQRRFLCKDLKFFLPEQFVSKHFNWFQIYRNLFVYSGSEDESPSKCNSTEKHILKVSFLCLKSNFKGGINTN